MKRAISIFVQFLVLLIVEGIGSIFYHPFHIQTVLSGTAPAPRSFVWDGVLLMVLCYLVLLAVAALRKRIGSSIPGATLALVLAALVGYMLRFGFITHNW